MTEITRDNWHEFVTEPPIAEEERAALEALYERMNRDPHLAAHVDLATVAEQQAFDDADIAQPGWACMAAKQDACRVLLRAQLQALSTYEDRQTIAALGCDLATEAVS